MPRFLLWLAGMAVAVYGVTRGAFELVVFACALLGVEPLLRAEPSPLEHAEREREAELEALLHELKVGYAAGALTLDEFERTVEAELEAHVRKQ